MDSAQQWVHEPQADDVLAIKQSTLRAMRRDGRLEAGTHWIYATGKAGGPVTYNLPESGNHWLNALFRWCNWKPSVVPLSGRKIGSIETFSDA